MKISVKNIDIKEGNKEIFYNPKNGTTKEYYIGDKIKGHVMLNVRDNTLNWDITLQIEYLPEEIKQSMEELCEQIKNYIKNNLKLNVVSDDNNVLLGIKGEN